jgi:tRNA(Ile)-lysidine synthase
MATITFPLTVRSFKEGDRFTPLGMNGSQKVKAFFINQKIGRSERLRCPILLSGERIIWVGGHRIDDSVKVTEKTQKLLKAELLQI